MAVSRKLWCLALRLLGDAVLLNEGSSDGRPDDLVGGDRHSVELIEAHNQSGKPLGPVGLLQVHRVSHRHHPCKLINGIRNQLSRVHTHLCQNGINQLTLRQGEV